RESGEPGAVDSVEGVVEVVSRSGLGIAERDVVGRTGVVGGAAPSVDVVEVGRGRMSNVVRAGIARVAVSRHRLGEDAPALPRLMALMVDVVLALRVLSRSTLLRPPSALDLPRRQAEVVPRRRVRPVM